MEVPQRDLRVRHQRVGDGRGVPRDEGPGGPGGPVGVLRTGVTQVQLDIRGPVDRGALLDVGVEDVGERRGGRVHRDGVLRGRIGQEVGVGGDDEINTALGLDDLHGNADLTRMFSGDRVDRCVPHDRGRHDSGLLRLLVGEQHAAVGVLFGFQALGPKRQGVGEAGLRPSLDLDELLEAGTGGFHHHIRAGHGVDIGGASTVHLRRRQSAAPLQGDLLVSLAERDQIGGRSGLGRSQGRRLGARLPGQLQPSRVRLGGNRTVGLSGQVDIHIAPDAPGRVLEAHRPGGQLGGERPVLVDPGGRRLGALGKRLDPLTGQLRGDTG